MTTKPTERIVVFVTPAQKLAITSTADALEISVSELMRRAVMNFNATSKQVKVAGLVDKLSGPKSPDPLAAVLRQVAERSAMLEARNATYRARETAQRASDAETAHEDALHPDAATPVLEIPSQEENDGVVDIQPAKPARDPGISRDYVRQTIYTVTTRMIISTATAAAIPLATAPHAISMKTSVVLQSLSVARLVRS